MAPIDVSEDTKNWLKVGLALKHLKKGLLPFVSQHLSALHTSIIRHSGVCNTCTIENILPCPTPGMCKFKHKRCQYHDQANPHKQARLCPTGVCEKVSGEIENNHVFGRPNWKNTDATKWASDPWEMAKCFLPPGYAGVQSAMETDCTAILSLCLNCLTLETAITPVKGLVEQNRTNRNEVMHSGSQELTATERGAYIQDAINLLTRYQTPIDPDTQTCIDILTELNTDGFLLTTDDFSDVILDAVDAIRQQQETIQDELESGRTIVEENKKSVVKLQAGKVDQETYMKKVTEMDKKLKSIYPKVQLLNARTQTVLRKRMEGIRKAIESIKVDIWKHIQTIEDDIKQLHDDMKQVKQVQKSEAEKRKQHGKELDEVKSKVTEHEEIVASHEMDMKQFKTLQTSEINTRKQQGMELDEVKSKVFKQEEMATAHEMDIDVMKTGMLKLEGKVEEIQEHSKQHGMKENNVQKHGRERLRAHLVNLYRKTCSKMPVAPPKRNMLADIKEHYREQDMRQVQMPHEPKSGHNGQANIMLKNKSKGDQEVQELTVVKSYHDVFNRKGQTCQNIYIKGEAGSGKSVFCQNMVNKWCDITSPGIQDNGENDDEAGSSNQDNGETDDEAGSSDQDNGETDDEAGSSDQDNGETDYEAGSSDQDNGETDYEAGSNHQDNGETDYEAGSSNQSDSQSSSWWEDNNTLLEPCQAQNNHIGAALLLYSNQYQIDKMNASLVRKFDFLFHIELRYATEHKDIISMVKETLLMGDDDLSNVLRDVLKDEPEKCLVLLDGLDEWAPPKGSPPAPHVTRGLPGRNITTNWTVLTTTRPWKLELIRPESEEMDQLIALSGLTQYSAQKSIDSVIAYLNKRYDKQKVASECQDYLGMNDMEYCMTLPYLRRSGRFKHFMTSPLLLKQLVCLWFDEGQVGESQCDLYAGMIDIYLRYSSQRQENPVSLAFSTSGRLPSCLNNRDTCKKYTCQLYSLSKLAFYTLFCEDRESSLVFNSTATEIHGMSEEETDMWLNVGLLSQDSADRGGSADHKMLSFPHKSIQEFLAAVYISVCDDGNITKCISDICASVDMLMEMSQVFVFVAGMKPSAFTKISEHIAEVANLDGNVQEYRACTNSDKSHIVAIHDLVLKCIKESKANHHGDIAIHILDIILGNRINRYMVVPIGQLDDAMKPDIELIRMNIADAVSLTLDGISGQGDFANYLHNILRQTSVQRFEKLRTIKAFETDLQIVTYYLERNQSTLERLSLTYSFTYLNDLTEAEIGVFPRLSHLQVICLSGLKLNYHQIKQILSLTQNSEMKEIEIYELECSPCKCVNCCENPFDMSQNRQLRRLKLMHFTLKRGNSEFTKQAASVSNEQFVNRNAIHINIEHMESCSITYINLIPSVELFANVKPRCCSVKFIGTPPPCMNLGLDAVALHHDQLLKVLSKTKCMRHIILSQLRCVDCGNICNIPLYLLEHTRLETLVLNEVELVRVSSDDINICFNTLKVNTEQLQHCTIDNDPRFRERYIFTMEFIGTAENLLYIRLSNIALRHGQFEAVMSFLARATSLEEVTMSELSCVDHGDACECQLDLTTHSALRNLTLQSVHGRCPQGTINTNSNRSSFSNQNTVNLYNVHTTALQIDTFRLQLDQLHINELTLHTTRLERCTITDVSRNDSESGQQESSLSTFEFVGNAECLCSLYLSNISLKHDQVQSMMSFVARATRLREITLSEVRCVDHGDTCECQLDLAEHKYIDILKLNRVRVNILKVTSNEQFNDYALAILDDTMDIVELHANALHVNTKKLKVDQSRVNELKVDTTRLKNCAITNICVLSTFEFVGTGECLRDLSLNNICLKHDQLQSVMSLVTLATRLMEVTLSELRCIDHGAACDWQLNLAEHKSMEILNLNRVRVNILKVTSNTSIQGWFRGNGDEDNTVSFVGLHANDVNIKTGNLNIDKSPVNELKIDTTQLKKCTITNISSNDSEPSQHASALAIFEFVGTGECLRELNLSNIDLTHDQLQGVMSFLTRATSLRELTLSELRCVTHGDACECQLDLAEHRYLGMLNIDRLHVNICIEALQFIESLKSLYLSNIDLTHDQLQRVMSFVTRTTCLREIILSELRCVDHGDTCEYQLDLAKHESILRLKIHRLHVNSMKVRARTEYTCPVQWFMSTNEYMYIYLDNVDIVELHANAVQMNTNGLKIDKSRINEVKVDTTRLTKCTITNISPKDSEHHQHESALSTFQFLGTPEYLQHLELRNINLNHEQFEEIISMITRTTCLRGIILSELKCVGHANHDMRECHLNLMDHKQLQRLEIDKLHVNQVQVDAARLQSCTLTSLKSASIRLIAGDTAASWSLPGDKGRACKRLVVGNVCLTNEELDGLVTVVTQKKGLCKISLYEIECSECNEECSRVDNLQQLVKFGKPDD